MTGKKMCIVTLRSNPAASVDVPGKFPRERGKKAGEAKTIERSVVGALRLFPGIPKTVTEDELDYMTRHRTDVATRLDRREYVESKRKELRGCTEAEVRERAEAEGVGHLPFKGQEKALLDRGKLVPPKRTPVKAVTKGGKAKAAPKPTKSVEEKKSGREPR
jgi:hypothetical protein